jgi:nucleotide-binding universal stress UspA family protein
MENKNEHILVTWDFTYVSQCALEHAVILSRGIQKEISLIHIVPPKTSAKEIENRKEKMSLVCEETGKKFAAKPNIIILEGTIFQTISEYATTTKASLVVMGTHGIKGMQRVFGSSALRVIIGSAVPFIVVQEKPLNNEKYSKLVFPIDFKSENKEKLSWAIFFGKYFGSKIQLFVYAVNDRSLKKKINTNLNFAIRFIMQNNLEYEIISPENSRHFTVETVDYADKIKADIILITTTKYITILDYMFGASEQKVIANNKKIPVMCVNPKANFATMGQFMFGQ